MEEEGAPEVEERGEDEQQQGGGGAPENRFLGVEFSFSPSA